MSNFSLRQWEGLSNPHFRDRPCYWTVFNHETQTSTKFYYKHDAIVYQRLFPHATIYFHWYEPEFARLNVAAEPVESHDELCRQRAQELRDTYKYLRLWFSGGADSQTALNSFVNNNIYLDEIVVVEYPDGDNANDPTSTTRRETEIVSVPALKKIAHLIPNTKITVLKALAKDASEWFNGSDDPATMSGFDSVDGNLAYSIDQTWAFCKINQQVDIEDHCDISGGSKVKLFKNQDRWYFYFVDCAIPDMHNSSRYEDFFISRTIPKLYLKTVYLLKNYFIIQGYSDSMINDITSMVNFQRHYNTGMGRAWVPDLATFKLFNVSHNPFLYKTTLLSGWNSEFFYKNTISTPEGQTWKKNYDHTIRAMMAISDDQWNVDKLGNIVPMFGRKGHLSKFYCLNDGLAYDSTQARQSVKLQIGL